MIVRMRLGVHTRLPLCMPLRYSHVNAGVQLFKYDDVRTHVDVDVHVAVDADTHADLHIETCV